jgi:CyaY protein
MDEESYVDLAHTTFRRLLDVFDRVDVEDADVESAGDVITITWRSGRKCVINTQRPARQIWLAAGDRAWHFRWDGASGSWVDDKGSGAELFATVAEIARREAGLHLQVGGS